VVEAFSLVVMLFGGSIRPWKTEYVSRSGRRDIRFHLEVLAGEKMVSQGVLFYIPMVNRNCSHRGKSMSRSIGENPLLSILPVAAGAVVYLNLVKEVHGSLNGLEV
jgi:hypothetical protein